jgi:serine/threonine protein kinase
MLSINQVLQQGRYHITNRIEHEETGVTYQAFDNVLQTKVIIKETSFDLKSSPNPYKYPIAKQMENLISIKHESFTQIHGFFSEVDHQYLVTEAVEGRNLKTLLEVNGRPFPLFTVLTWTEQLLDALNYLHSKIPPIIHRDITPTNLTLTADNKIKLLTYPIIKEFNPQKGNHQSGNVGQQQLPFLPLEVLWETLDYASQKVILNSYDEPSAEILESPIDERSDIYALGATIYYLITGRVPIDTLERSIELLEGKEDPLTSPNKINSQVPRNVATFLLKALEIRRENRFESASAMRQALQPMLELMRKVELEKQRAVEDPKVIKSALQEVELARQALRKQREAELRKNQAIEEWAVKAEKSTLSILENETVEEKIVEVPALAEKTENQPPAAVSMTPAELPPAREKAASESILVVAAAAATGEIKDLDPVDFKEEKPANIDLLPTQIDAEPDVVRKAEQSIDEDDSNFFLSAQMEPKRTSWLIPMICVVVLLAVGGFFGYKFLGAQNPVKGEQTAPEQKASTTTEPTPAASASPAENTVAAPATIGTQPTPAAPALEAQETGEPESKAKKAPAAVDKKPAPAAAKTPAPKKKELTVDDLINDN